MKNKRFESYNRIVFALILRIALNILASVVPALNLVSIILGVAIIVYIIIIMQQAAMKEELVVGEKPLQMIFYVYVGLNFLTIGLPFAYIKLSASNPTLATILASMYTFAWFGILIVFFLFLYRLVRNIQALKPRLS